METRLRAEDTVVVIFGAAGDLTWRKLVPALYNLFLDSWLPDRFAIIGVDRKGMTDEEFRLRLEDGVDCNSRRGKADHKSWEAFVSHVAAYIATDFNDPSGYSALSAQLDGLDKKWGTRANRLFYQAAPPMVLEPLVGQMEKASLAHDRERVRIVVEKPFGRDLASARSLNRTLTSVFEESQIFRMDHYLGKETVQNILAFRFANALFEPVWDRRYIDHAQITVAEMAGVEHRGRYYDQTGALRDMVQSHLMQLLCMIAMEAPVSFSADEIRSKKVDVLRAIRPIPESQLRLFAVRGQYGPGRIEGKHHPSYRDEPDITADSPTESYAAVKLFVDNWRWQDIPFYLRTGKRLPARVSEVSIQFRPVPHQLFPSSAVANFQPNRLVIRIQPDEGILLRFQAKHPGQIMRLAPVDMRFSYKESFEAPPREAYETLLLDVMLGDATQFKRADQVETSWSAVMPVLDAWQSIAPEDFPNYSAGSWGPEAADSLMARDGRHWALPSLYEARREEAPTAP